jgi:spoIIIJ-associated protein
MRYVEKIARTIDDAITEALIELGATREEVNIEILDKGSKGFLGIGAKEAKVKVSVQELETTPEVFSKYAEVLEVVNPPYETSIEEAPIVDLTDDDNTDLNDLRNKAITFLQQILKEMNIDGQIENELKDGKLYIKISGENMGVIIGRRGETLDALQYLINIAVNKGKDKYLKVMLDTENYREKREETLKNLAFTLAKKAYRTKKIVELEPMNPYDRRIIHSALQNNKYVKTNSEGVDPHRKVIITPIYSGQPYKSTK